MMLICWRIITEISKSEAMKLTQNIDFSEKRGTLSNIRKLFWYIKISKEILTFSGIKTLKNNFYCYSSPIFLGDVDINNILGSDKFSLGEKNYKYIIVYLSDNFKFKPLHIMLPKTKAYVKS